MDSLLSQPLISSLHPVQGTYQSAQVAGWLEQIYYKVKNSNQCIQHDHLMTELTVLSSTQIYKNFKVSIIRHTHLYFYQFQNFIILILTCKVVYSLHKTSFKQFINRCISR